MLQQSVERLVKESLALASTVGAEREEAEAPLRAAVSLLERAGAVGAARPDAVMPESYLLCGEGALEVANVPLARTCLERFFHAGPRATQHLARAYFALGRVQSAEAEATNEAQKFAVAQAEATKRAHRAARASGLRVGNNNLW